MNFVAIDFETANPKRTSACSLGIAVVKNSEITETKYWLIRPHPFEFNYFNKLVNGFGEDKLYNKPLFRDHWSEIQPYLENQTIIAHNASFDVSVLLNTLDHYEIDYPHFRYLCSFKASQKIFKNLINHQLDTIANTLGIYFTHHNAVEDAKATAEVLLHMIRARQCGSIDDFAKSLNLRFGKVNGSYHTTCKYIGDGPVRLTSSHSIPLSKKIVPTFTDFDEDNEFYGKTVVFTGALNGMSRNEAYQIIANAGGKPLDNVTKRTDYLILGTQDYRMLNGHTISSKTRKAIEYVKTGTGIQIISEDQFYKMIGGENGEQSHSGANL